MWKITYVSQGGRGPIIKQLSFPFKRGVTNLLKGQTLITRSSRQYFVYTKDKF